MAIPTPTIRRLFREHFSDASPLQVKQEERATVTAQIRQRLAGMKYVESERTNYYIDQREKDRFLFTLDIKEPSAHASYRDSTSFTFKLNERGQLTIAYWRQQATVASLDEIVAFVQACQEVVERKLTQKSKRQKVRELKAQAIMAQVKKLAKADQFDFYTETDTQKLTLYVRLSERESVELQIPFNKFEAVLPQLRTSIQSLRELYAQGIKFKIGQASPSGWQNQRWIEHKTL